MNTIAQSTQVVKCDSYGWPINPATHLSYSADELATDPELPLPTNKFAARYVRRLRDQAAGTAESKPRQKSKLSRRSNSQKAGRHFQASQVLSSFTLQAEEHGEAMADLVSRVNGQDGEALTGTSPTVQAGHTIIILSNNTWVYVPEDDDPDIVRAQKEAELAYLIADGVHPNDDPADPWLVVVDGEPVAWAETEATAWRSYHELMDEAAFVEVAL